jgi:hypothetical protein
MSAWDEMRERGAGKLTRRENEIQDVFEFSDPLPQPITFVGNIDKSTIPSIPTAGQLYFTNDVVTINGVEYPSGCMLLYDGTKWINVGDFVHQRVDANIGYWVNVDNQPKNII